VGREGAPLGRVAETEHARFIGLADLGRALAAGRTATPAEEAQAVIDSAATLLEQEGFSFREVARTWFYLRDILDWYGPFNAARNAAFRGLGLLGANSDGIPASTGIEGRNLRAGAWCTLDLVAARPRAGGHFEMKPIQGGLQNDPTGYGAAFARGVSLTLAAERLVFVSGTASIDAQGATVHVGDFEAQLRHTVDAVQAILANAGTRLGDVCQATAFLKNPDDAAAYARLAERSGLAGIPVIAAVADICRPELLFELEATALVTLPASA
jgi:enamine deaminase RidA (YjgF/YER057c/UK114 family)